VYLLFVLPFYRFLQRTFRGQETPSPYLLELNGTKASATMLRDRLRTLLQEHLSVSFGINVYRQYMEYMLRSVMKIPSESVGEQEEDTIYNYQFNHSTNTGQMVYGRDASLFSHRTQHIN
jgi:hypothetical protein